MSSIEPQTPQPPASPEAPASPPTEASEAPEAPDAIEVDAAASADVATPAAGAEQPSLSIDDEVQRELDAAGEAGGVDALMEASLQPEAPATTQAKDDAPTGDATQSEPEFHHQIVRGRIAAIRGEDVFVDITGGLAQGGGGGGKLQGVVPLVQFDRPPRLGSIMDFVVNQVDEKQGLVFLSREGAISLSTWDQLTKGAVVEARVTRANKGGLELEMVGSIRAFMPASQIDLAHTEDMEAFVGQKLEAVVAEIDRKAKKVLLSRRAYLEKQQARAKEKLLKELEVGQERDGTVSSVMDFGAFVDLGGVDGLVHVTDLSHAHVAKPSDAVKVGDAVKVKVLKIEEVKVNAKGKPSDTGEHTRLRIALGIKQIEPDPWDGVSNKYTVGEQVTARVTRTAPFGAFVELEPGVEGLLPISEMSWKRINTAEEVVKGGDVIHVAILRIEPRDKKLTLSLKAAKGDPWQDAAAKYARDMMVEGTVLNTTDFGAFVELEQGVEGLVHISELSDRRVGQVTDVVKPGDVKRFRIKDLDTDKRKISLSLKPPGRDEPSADTPIVKGPARKRLPKESLKSGLGDIGTPGGKGLGGLSLDDFK